MLLSFCIFRVLKVTIEVLISYVFWHQTPSFHISKHLIATSTSLSSLWYHPSVPLSYLYWDFLIVFVYSEDIYFLKFHFLNFFYSLIMSSTSIDYKSIELDSASIFFQNCLVNHSYLKCLLQIQSTYFYILTYLI